MYYNTAQAETTLYQTYAKADLKLYNQALAKGKRGRIRAVLSKQHNQLLTLEQIIKEKDIQQRSYRGLRSVPIRLILGSEGRTEDFDQEFNPLKKHNRQRWMNIAAARYNGKSLPAVDLIQIGDIYVVRDGHHRISVAKSLGEEYIDAKVTCWKVKK
jgi:hypothetical protein